MESSSLSFDKKKEKKGAKYSIITFDMHKPKGNKYPSFDFGKLKKELGEDSDEDDERFHDKDALELCRRMDQKYGNKTTKSGRKMTFAEDDFIDKSLGYDLDDDFIDDSEVHDELVPSTLDTKKGGFYVNKGKLDFVSIGDDLSDEEDSEDEADKPKKKKKKEEPVASTSKPTAKPAVRAPKRPYLKADEAKKTLETKPQKRAATSSSPSRQSQRKVGGPPTNKKGKAAAAAPAAKAAEPRPSMVGKPPTLRPTRSETAARPSLAAKRPPAAAAAAPDSPKKPAPIQKASVQPVIAMSNGEKRDEDAMKAKIDIITIED